MLRFLLCYILATYSALGVSKETYSVDEIKKISGFKPSVYELVDSKPPCVGGDLFFLDSSNGIHLSIGGHIVMSNLDTKSKTVIDKESGCRSLIKTNIKSKLIEHSKVETCPQGEKSITSHVRITLRISNNYLLITSEAIEADGSKQVVNCKLKEDR